MQLGRETQRVCVTFARFRARTLRTGLGRETMTTAKKEENRAAAATCDARVDDVSYTYEIVLLFSFISIKHTHTHTHNLMCIYIKPILVYIYIHYTEQ